MIALQGSTDRSSNLSVGLWNTDRVSSRREGMICEIKLDPSGSRSYDVSPNDRNMAGIMMDGSNRFRPINFSYNRQLNDEDKLGAVVNHILIFIARQECMVTYISNGSI